MLHADNKMSFYLPEIMRNRGPLVVVILFFITSNLIWFSMDQAPPMWDQSHYLWNSEILYHELAGKGFLSFVLAFTEIFQVKAPLITALPLPFYIIFGNTYANALYINLIFMIFASYFLYNLGIFISGEKEALLSVFVLNVFPLIIGMSREFLTEYGLMTFVIIWMYYLLRYDSFEKRKISCILGIILGLGMLMKISFILYIAFPTLFVLIRRVYKSPKIIGLTFANLVMITVIGTLIAGPWYYKNWSSVIHFAIASGYGNSANKWGMGEIFSVKTILAYWLYLINYGISAYFFFLIMLLLVAKIFSLPACRPAHKVERSYVLILAIWFLFPFILFSFGVNKDYRYAAPFLPVVALLISILLVRMTSIRFGNIVLSFLLFFPLFNYFYISFSFTPFHYEIANLKILDRGLAYAHPPIREKWPIEKIVKILSTASLKNGDNYPRISLLFDHNYINFINLNYYASKHDDHIIFDIHNYYAGKSPDEIAEIITRQSSYVMTKSDKLGPDISDNENIRHVMNMLAQGKLRFRQMQSIPLPDKTIVMIYRKI